MILEFNPSKIPRTMTRAEWRECSRWLRQCSRIIGRALTEQFARDAMTEIQKPVKLRKIVVS